jgi:hypothetical protein
MRLLTWAGIGVVSLTLGISAARAQDEPKRPEEPKQEQNDARPQQAPADQDRQEMKQEQNQAPKADKQTKEDKQQQKDDAKAAKESGKQDQTKQDQMNRDQMNRDQMNHAQANQGQMNHAQPANGKSGHIPDNDFKAHFGRSHTVVINRPVVVEGQPRFQYGGYWFVISDPWPGDWAYSDQCYIDYVDGEYFLFDLLHPGVRIALFVVVS